LRWCRRRAVAGLSSGPTWWSSPERALRPASADAQFAEKGARVVATRAEAFAADVAAASEGAWLQSRGGAGRSAVAPAGRSVIGLCEPIWNPAAPDNCRAGRDAVRPGADPSHHAAQSMDVLSFEWPRSPDIGPCCWPPRHSAKMFPLMTTAAGTITPAKVFICRAPEVAGCKRSPRPGGWRVVPVRGAVSEHQGASSTGGKSSRIPLDTAAAEGTGGYCPGEWMKRFYRRQREFDDPRVGRERRGHHHGRHPAKKPPCSSRATWSSTWRPAL